ncbi:MAG: hypothetical protein II747_02875 [Clostridia bacterium]|nr:hypothetical protein [Clostridia bacterium]
MFDRKKGMRVSLVLMLHGHGYSRVVYSADGMTVLSEGKKTAEIPGSLCAVFGRGGNGYGLYSPAYKKAS